MLAGRDPGGPGDWLDTEGRPFGLFVFRFLQAEREPELPTVRRCAVADLGRPGRRLRRCGGRRPGPLPRRARYAAAEADREARPERYRLDPDQIAAAAVRTAGDEDRVRGRVGVRASEQYLGSASEDGRLTALGIGMVASTAVGRLRAGAAIGALPRRRSRTRPRRR